jgi:multimeric flavodoxin WrbA
MLENHFYKMEDTAEKHDERATGHIRFAAAQGIPAVAGKPSRCWKATDRDEYLSLHDKTSGRARPVKCAKDKNRCAQEDDFMPVYEAMAAADGLLVGSPVYFGSATPNLMALLDRAGYVARMGDNPFYRKVGSPVVVARRAGVNFTYAQLQLWFVIMGMFVPGSTYWPIAYGLKPGEVAQDAEGMKTVDNLAENMAWLMKKIR